MEILFEIVAEIYLEFAMCLMPEKKLHPALKFFLKFICVLVSLAILLTLFGGVMILVDPGMQDAQEVVSPWLLIGIGAGLVVIQVVLMVITEVRRKNKR